MKIVKTIVCAILMLALGAACAESLEALELTDFEYPDTPFVIPVPAGWESGAVSREDTDFYALDSGADAAGKLLIYACVNTAQYADDAAIADYYARFVTGTVSNIKTQSVLCDGHPALLYRGSMQVGGDARPVYGLALLSGQDFLCLLYWGDARDGDECAAFVARIAEGIRVAR